MSISICNFFKPKDGLPDPEGPLSGDLTTKAIQAANSEVAKVLSEANTSKKKPRGPYKK